MACDDFILNLFDEQFVTDALCLRNAKMRSNQKRPALDPVSELALAIMDLQARGTF